MKIMKHLKKYLDIDKDDAYCGWLCFTSHGQRRHLEMAPHLLSLAKDMKVGFYTDSPRIEPWAIAGNPLHTAAPRQLPMLIMIRS